MKIFTFQENAHTLTDIRVIFNNQYIFLTHDFKPSSFSISVHYSISYYNRVLNRTLRKPLKEMNIQAELKNTGPLLGGSGEI